MRSADPIGEPDDGALSGGTVEPSSYEGEATSSGITDDEGRGFAVLSLRACPMSATENESSSPHPGSAGAGSDPPDETARNRRLVVIVEAFLRQVRNGGSLDPEPFLKAASDLRGDLAPLLHGVLRLEQISLSMESQRKTPTSNLPPGPGAEESS